MEFSGGEIAVSVWEGKSWFNENGCTSSGSSIFHGTMIMGERVDFQAAILAGNFRILAGNFF